MKRMLTLAALATAATITPAQAIDPPVEIIMTPEAVGELGYRTMALWRCAELAHALDHTTFSERQFTSGYAHGSRFIIELNRIRDSALWARAAAKVPDIVLINLVGPSNDFMLGRMHSAIALAIEGELGDRDTSAHQERRPRGRSLSIGGGDQRKLIAGRAEKARRMYLDENCGQLS